MWRWQSLSVDCPPPPHALCRPLPGWSCVHSGIAHWMPPLLSSGLEPSFRRAIAQHNMRIRGHTGPRQQKHSGTSLQYTCPAQHHLPGTAPLARHSTTCPAQHHLPGTAPLARHSGTSLAAQPARHSTRQGVAPRFASICVMCSTSRRLSRLSVFVGTRYPE